MVVDSKWRKGNLGMGSEKVKKRRFERVLWIENWRVKEIAEAIEVAVVFNIIVACSSEY